MEDYFIKFKDQYELGYMDKNYQTKVKIADLELKLSQI